MGSDIEIPIFCLSPKNIPKILRVPLGHVLDQFINFNNHVDCLCFSSIFFENAISCIDLPISDQAQTL